MGRGGRTRRQCQGAEAERAGDAGGRAGVSVSDKHYEP